MSSDWRNVRLGNVATVNPEKTPAWDPPHIIKYVDIASVDANRGIQMDKVQEVAFGDAPGRARRLIRSGDVLVSTVRPNLRAFAPVPADLEGEVASTGFAVIRANREFVSPEFLWAVVRTPRFVEDMVRKCTGSNYPAVRAGDVADHSFVLPDANEQRRIVDLIDAVDDVTRSKIEKLSKLKILFASTLEKMVGGVPPADEAVALGEQFRVIDCEHKTAPATAEESFARSIGTSDIRGGRFLLETAKAVSEATFLEWTARAEPTPGDVVLTREAPVGQVALVTPSTGRLCLGQRTVLLRPTGSIPGAYIWAALLSESYQRFLRERSIGQTVERVNVKLVKELPVRIPEASYSLRVIEAAEALADTIDAEQSNLDSIRHVHSELLSALLSGAHRIPETYDELMGA
ncbi:putative Type I restriction enzyme S subunit [Arthrobacter sp. 9V]|uniref:restriction endonuclease subunit S n=1 Tax=Arthrobacter sp. 9V TaxID=2653132 RepID=UPI0012EFFABD|nr:restriction endonuclease subunit S [Arthrobacter sp. 9V]VXB67030.1 putative Type I restriction enzyme S subunit [Arthrobacter sp. 9V]